MNFDYAIIDYYFYILFIFIARNLLKLYVWKESKLLHIIDMVSSSCYWHYNNLNYRNLLLKLLNCIDFVDYSSLEYSRYCGV